MPLLDNNIRWGRTGCWTLCRVRCRTAQSSLITHFEFVLWSVFTLGLMKILIISHTRWAKTDNIKSNFIRFMILVAMHFFNFRYLLPVFVWWPNFYADCQLLLIIFIFWNDKKLVYCQYLVIGSYLIAIYSKKQSNY